MSQTDVSFPRQGNPYEDAPDSVRSIIPQCQNCIFRDKKNPTLCAAFPGGIPTVILLNQFDHRHVWPGQINDVVFYPYNKRLPFPIDDNLP